jgi:hypothetical protein
MMCHIQIGGLSPCRVKGCLTPENHRLFEKISNGGMLRCSYFDPSEADLAVTTLTKMGYSDVTIHPGECTQWMNPNPEVRL